MKPEPVKKIPGAGQKRTSSATLPASQSPLGLIPRQVNLPGV